MEFVCTENNQHGIAAEIPNVYREKGCGLPKCSRRPLRRSEEDAMKATLAVIVGLIGTVLAAPALAHHSFAVEYDKEKPVEGTARDLEGRVDEPAHARLCRLQRRQGCRHHVESRAREPQQRHSPRMEAVGSQAGAKISFKGFGGRKVLTRAAADVLTLADGRSFAGASGAPDGSKECGVGAGVPIP